MSIFLNTPSSRDMPSSRVATNTPSSRGLSAGSILIELMLASLLGLLLVSIVFEIYVTTQKSFRLKTALNQIQDNAKTAVDILSSDIHQAGYIGCAKLTNDFPIFSYEHYSITPQNKLTVTDSSMTIRHAAANSAELITTMQSPFILETSQRIKFKNNTVLIISDCKHAEIFRVKNVSYSHGVQKIIPEAPLHILFDAHAEISQFEINHFFVAKSNLYIENIHKSKIRLIDGIDAMRIKYDATESKCHGAAIEMDMHANVLPLRKIWYAYVSI